MASYWIIALLLQRSEGFTSLVQEIDSARAIWTANNPGFKFDENISEFISESALPLLDSTIQETLRFATNVIAIRDVTAPLEFSGFHFEKGEKVRIEKLFL
jgi:cytochrome P450